MLLFSLNIRCRLEAHSTLAAWYDYFLKLWCNHKDDVSSLVIFCCCAIPLQYSVRLRSPHHSDSPVQLFCNAGPLTRAQLVLNLATHRHHLALNSRSAPGAFKFSCVLSSTAQCCPRWRRRRKFLVPGHGLANRRRQYLTCWTYYGRQRGQRHQAIRGRARQPFKLARLWSWKCQMVGEHHLATCPSCRSDRTSTRYLKYSTETINAVERRAKSRA